MKRIKIIQYPFVQPPDDTIVRGGVEKITSNIDGVDFSKASGEEISRSPEGRTRRQIFIPKQNYWFIEVTDPWVEKWDLNTDSPGRNIDRLLLAFNSHIDPGVLFTTTARFTHNHVMFGEDGIPITRDGDFGSGLRALSTEPKHINVDVNRVSEVLEKLMDMSISHTDLEEAGRDWVNAMELFTDGLYSFDAIIQWTYFWFCLENLIGEGYKSGEAVVDYLTEMELMNKENATNWKDSVDRIKHPDKGVTGDKTESSLPRPIKCREVTSEIFIDHVLDNDPL